MKLNGHLIEDAAIKGIGPLHEEQHPDEAEALGYGSARYYYDVHLVSRTARIYSPWFCRTSEEGKQAMAQWRQEHTEAYSQMEARFQYPFSFPTDLINAR